MNGVRGTLSGPPVTVASPRPAVHKPLSRGDARTLADRVLQLLRSTGLRRSDVHRVLAELPRSRVEAYLRCNSLASKPFGPPADGGDA